MDRISRWVEDQIVDHLPDHSDKHAVAVLLDACAALGGKSGQLFGMSMPAIPDAEALYARACAALSAWFHHLDAAEADALATRIRHLGLDIPIPTTAVGSSEDLETCCERLFAAREQSLRRLGDVVDKVLSRSHPMGVDGTMFCWPANALGRQRLVRKPSSVLLVTDGLSNPWDPSLHESTPEWTFGFELAIEVPLAAFDDPSDAKIAASWAPVVLWAATDWVVAERANPLDRLELFHVITHAIPPIGGLEDLVASNGFIGGLIGIPYAGDVIGTSLAHGPDPHRRDVQTSLLTMKLLTADEYEWSMGVRDSSRAVALAEKFLERDRHLSWPDRPSVLR